MLKNTEKICDITDGSDDRRENVRGVGIGAVITGSRLPGSGWTGETLAGIPISGSAFDSGVQI